MSKLEQILEESLARLSTGEATLEECLARYPEHAASLRPLLTAAGKLEQSRTVQPSPVFKGQARAQLLAHMRQHPRQVQPGWWERLFPQGVGPALGRAFNAASSLAALVLLVLGTVTVLAQTALPGDALYRWKVRSERVWRAVHFDPFNTDLLLASRRVAELMQVAGNPLAEEIARQEYQQSLATLMTEYPSSASQEIISNTLVEQKDNLAQAGLMVPELDRALGLVSLREAALLLNNEVTEVNNNLITYTLTITNAGPANSLTATLTSDLSPAETLISAEGAACTATTAGDVTCALDNLTTSVVRQVQMTTTIDPCYTGVLTHTSTITGTDRVANTNLNNTAVAVSTVNAPYPRPAQVVYVQSSNQSHNLGLVAASSRLLNGELHLRAAAPAWAPDGATLAFFGEANINELGGLYSQGSGVWLADVAEAQIQTPRQLVAQDHIKNIAWSFDQTKLAFEVGPPGLPHEIRVIEAATGRELSRFPGEQPAWQPDTEQLIIKSCAPECGLWQVNLAGKLVKQLTFAASDSYPVWSPTGQHLAFASQRDEDWEIYLLHLADNNLVRLTQRPGSDTTPAFDACGQNLYLRTDVYGSWSVNVMRLDGSNERKVQEDTGASDDWGLARPAVF